MDLKQSYYDYLAEQGAKEKVKEIIAKGIEEWKAQPAYEYKPTVDPFTNDYSGKVNRIYDKNIGDICTTDIDVLQAYTGDSMATYVSHCGLSYRKVADDIREDLMECLSHLRHEFIHQHEQELLEYFNDEVENILSRNLAWVKRKDFNLPLDGAGYDYIVDFMSDELPHYDWMKEQFPEYMVEDEFGGEDYLLDVMI